MGSQEIPAEVIGLYLSIHAIASSQADISWVPFGFIFMIGMLVTVFYLKVYLKVSSTRQVAISAGAFFFWALAINSSSTHSLLGIHGYWAGICVLLYAFVVPKIPIDSKPDGKNTNRNQARENGKAVTSLIESAPLIAISKRSTPRATPAHSGRPCSIALSR